MLRRLPYLLLLPAMLSCSKSDSSPTIDFGEGEGISYRDGNNLPAGPQDPTDWKSDGNWNQAEQNLFKSIPVNVKDASKGSLYGAGFYPNPVRSKAIIFYRTPVVTTCKLVIVDKDYNVLTENTFSNSIYPLESFTLNLFGSNFQKGRRYRLYYVMYNGTTLYTKGHGDIKMAE
ncbi:hypothetical protein [Hymenobacter sp. IS2118]|uniref:hypothetical protein n=1 Tax=Hymenobacter sp. IS2118 TaxID=1505605 RepID=UPI00126800A8|nr:hypothetical protein [Hymenobacter sp. IS2118]